MKTKYRRHTLSLPETLADALCPRDSSDLVHEVKSISPSESSCPSGKSSGSRNVKFGWLDEKVDIET